LHFAPHALHFMLVPDTCIFAIDPTEQRLKGPVEQAQVEDFTNLDLNQGKPRCINQCFLSFIFKYIFMFYFDCALSL
jgi:hypothetical protein